jgi:hypothetical protein
MTFGVHTQGQISAVSPFNITNHCFFAITQSLSIISLYSFSLSLIDFISNMLVNTKGSQPYLTISSQVIATMS